jgi:RHS repeat-associated protein
LRNFFFFLIKYSGFIDGTNTGDDYEYDEFGNMLLDRNKGITSIEYNHLNLPRRINFASGGNIIYIYNAQGVKLQKTVNNPNSTQASTRYRGGFQYDNTTLQFVHTAEGYIKHTINPFATNPTIGAYHDFDYVYNYTDHLGNIRLSYTLDPATQEIKVMEENHYYPFGLKHTYNLDRRSIGYEEFEQLNNTQDTRRTRMVSNNGYQYKYNGKEWQDELGLNVTAMDFRQYDPAIGRFYGMDRLSELAYSITPYRFAYNNPVYWSDPTGLLEEGIDLGGSSISNMEAVAFPVEPGKNRGDIHIDSDGQWMWNGGFWIGLNGTPDMLNDVEVSATQNNQSNSNNQSTNNRSSWWYSLFYNHGGFGLWGSNRYGDLGGHRNGSRKHSIEEKTLPIMGSGKARSVTGTKGLFEWLFSYWVTKHEMVSRLESIYEIAKEGNTSSVTVQNREPVTPPEEQLVTITFNRINNVAEPYGSNGLRINTGPGNMQVPRKDSLNMVNKMDNIFKRELDSINNKYNN